ncbi:hypothetical protein IODZLFCR_CDS0002 [Salmonella phage vB_SalP_SE29]|uniref:Uncharacterized protein n=1 Tax=Salmonella phage vB_SalP_SE29 TaxID=3134913 RepID=A0AAX4LZ27_9CAUD
MYLLRPSISLSIHNKDNIPTLLFWNTLRANLDSQGTIHRI